MSGISDWWRWFISHSEGSKGYPFNSHEWPRQNLSLQYQYNIKQTSDENEEKYQLRDYELIQYQILQTQITRTVWKIVRRITNEITLIGVLATGLGSFWLLNKFLFRKCVGNSMENMLTDVRVLRVNVMDCTCIDHRRPSTAKRESQQKSLVLQLQRFHWMVILEMMKQVFCLERQASSTNQVNIQ